MRKASRWAAAESTRPIPAARTGSITLPASPLFPRSVPPRGGAADSPGYPGLAQAGNGGGRGPSNGSRGLSAVGSKPHPWTAWGPTWEEEHAYIPDPGNRGHGDRGGRGADGGGRRQRRHEHDPGKGPDDAVDRGGQGQDRRGPEGRHHRHAAERQDPAREEGCRALPLRRQGQEVDPGGGRPHGQVRARVLHRQAGRHDPLRAGLPRHAEVRRQPQQRRHRAGGAGAQGADDAGDRDGREHDHRPARRTSSPAPC